jgi:hypothetical protein
MRKHVRENAPKTHLRIRYAAEFNKGGAQHIRSINAHLHVRISESRLAKAGLGTPVVPESAMKRKEKSAWRIFEQNRPVRRIFTSEDFRKRQFWCGQILAVFSARDNPLAKASGTSRSGEFPHERTECEPLNVRSWLGRFLVPS